MNDPAMMSVVVRCESCGGDDSYRGNLPMSMPLHCAKHPGGVNVVASAVSNIIVLENKKSACVDVMSKYAPAGPAESNDKVDGVRYESSLEPGKNLTFSVRDLTRYDLVLYDPEEKHILHVVFSYEPKEDGISDTSAATVVRFDVGDAQT